MTRMAIQGIGVVGAMGRGLESLAHAGRRVLGGDRNCPAARAETEGLRDFLPPRALRRMDHFTRMTLLAAFDAVQDAGLQPDDLRDAGIVLATGYGPAGLTFEFLDSIIDYGPDMASPQAFAHSVHNIPAASAALSLGVNGPCSTVSQLDSGVTAAFLTAQAWMAEGRVSRVLLGAADERTDLLDAVTSRITPERPLKDAGRRRGLPRTDGAVFFCLHADAAAARRGIIADIALSDREWAPPLLLSGSLSEHRRAGWPGAIDLSPAYGNLPVALAFDTALAALAVSGELTLLRDAGAVTCASRDPFGNIGSLTVSAGGRP